MNCCYGVSLSNTIWIATLFDLSGQPENLGIKSGTVWEHSKARKALIKRGVILTCVIVLGLMGVLSNTPAAHAGTNGQQIWFTSDFNSLASGVNRACPSGPLQVVYIEGTNQNGKPSVWVD